MGGTTPNQHRQEFSVQIDATSCGLTSNLADRAYRQGLAIKLSTVQCLPMALLPARIFYLKRRQRLMVRPAMRLAPVTERANQAPAVLLAARTCTFALKTNCLDAVLATRCAMKIALVTCALIHLVVSA